MANWCGHRIVPIKDNVYKVEYDLALVLPFLKLKDNFTVMYKVSCLDYCTLSSIKHEFDVRINSNVVL